MNIVNSLMKDLLISGGWSESCVQMYQHDYVKPNIIEIYMLQTVLNTFGRTDGVCVTTQTKQRVIENIHELLESVEHGR